MLDELRVVNLGILKDVTIDPGDGLTVISGETGAGKTMLLGALRLLTGQRAPTDAIGPNDGEATVEGRIRLDDREVVLARRVLRTGSRAYLDGHMVPNRLLEDATADLIDIVGQNDRFHLVRSSELRSLVDTQIPDRSVVEEYRTVWATVQDLEGDMKALGGDRAALERERDLLRYQQRDIASGDFRPGDDESLLIQAARLRNAGELAERLAHAREVLDSLVEQTGVLGGELKAVAGIDPSSEQLAHDADELSVLAGELTSRLREASEAVEHDPALLEETELRLARLGELRRKYGPTLADVLGFAESVTARLQDLERLLDSAQALGDALDAARSELADRGDALLEARRTAAADIESATAAHLSELGLQGAVLHLLVEPAQAGPDGSDTIKIMFSSDVRMKAGPLSRTASGGELSRVVLALRLAAGTSDAPILVFDEIDSGVGGETALALGRKLAQLARGRQVLCVSHLPQVAAYADHHLVVTRNGTEAFVESVEGEERLRELARMLAGLPESVQGRLHARELLAEARSR